MKPFLRFNFVLFALILAIVTAAEGTTVTGTTVSSGDGQLLTNAKITAEFIPKPGTSGSPVITSVTATTDINGTFSMSLTDVNTVNPRGGTWKFTVCPNATVACTVIPNVVITGTTQEIGGLITANIPTLSVTAQTILPKAYNDSQVPVVDLSNTGAMYWNTVDKTIHIWDGGIWNNISPVGNIKFVNSVTTGTDWCAKVSNVLTQLAGQPSEIWISHDAVTGTACSTDITLATRQVLRLVQGGDYSLAGHRLLFSSYSGIVGVGQTNNRILCAGISCLAPASPTTRTSQPIFIGIGIWGDNGAGGANTTANAVGLDLTNTMNATIDDIHIVQFGGTGAAGALLFGTGLNTYYNNFSNFKFENNTNGLVTNSDIAGNAPNANHFVNGNIVGGTSCVRLITGTSASFSNVHFENCPGTGGVGGVDVASNGNVFSGSRYEDHTVGDLGIHFAAGTQSNFWEGGTIFATTTPCLDDAKNVAGFANRIWGPGFGCESVIPLVGALGLPDTLNTNIPYLVGNPSGVGYTGKMQFGDGTGRKFWLSSSRSGGVDTDRLGIDDLGRLFMDNYNLLPKTLEGDTIIQVRNGVGATANHAEQLQYYDRTGVLQFTCGKNASNVYQCVDNVSGKYLLSFANPGGNGVSELSGTGTGAVNLNNNGTGGTVFLAGDGAFTNVASVNNAGKGTFKGGAQIGTNGTAIGTILTATATLTFTAIAAQTCQEQPLTITNSSTTNFGVTVSPRATLGNVNLGWSGWVSAAGTVSVRVCNHSTGSITPSAVAWGATVIQ